MKRLVLLAFALVVSCKHSEPAAPPVLLENGAVAADMPAARAIGEKVLAEGGNAVDAAVAVTFALGVENPGSSGIGGGGFAVVWEARSRRAFTLDFRETAPRGAREANYLDARGEKVPGASLIGCHAAGVPGEVAGLAALHSRFGTKRWESLVEPARVLAEKGWEVSPFLARVLLEQQDEIGARPELAAVYLEADGTVHDAGDLLRDPELASTLDRIAREKAAGFYRGEVALAIESACRETDGAITREDLAAYQPVWRAPVVSTFRGASVVTAPPPASGGVVLIEVLNVLEAFEDFDRRKDPTSWHVMIEAMKHGFADRVTSFGDPDFVALRTDELVSKTYAAELRKTIDAARTQPASVYEMHNKEESPIPLPTREAGTSHVAIVDRWGNAVSLTTSVNEYLGSLVRAPKAGVLLNDTIDDFSFAGAKNTYGLSGSRKNAIAPRKRPVSSMAPVIVIEDGRVRLVTGGSGGPRITTGATQVVLGVLAEGRDVAGAVEAPRVHTHLEKGAPDRVWVETTLPADVAAALAARGHEIAPPKYGVTNSVEVKDGRAIAATDPRKNGVIPKSEPVPAPKTFLAPKR